MDLIEARQQLDQIDSQLLALFEQRMRVVSTIADYKRAQGLPTQDKAREQEILDRVQAQGSVELAPYSQELMRKLLELSRRYQQRRRGAPAGRALRR